MNVWADYRNDGTDQPLPIQKVMSYSQAPKPEYTAVKHLEEKMITSQMTKTIAWTVRPMQCAMYA